MLVIVTCFESSEPFGFLTRQIPVTMLPVLNKPLLEHLLEQCADAGLTRIRIALLDHPMPVRQFLGKGERWGLDVDTWDFKEPCTEDVLVARLAQGYTGAVLVVPAETIVDMDFKALLAFHAQQSQPGTRVVSRDNSAGSARGAAPLEAAESGSDDAKMHDTGIRILDAPARATDSARTFVCPGTWIRVDSPTKLWEANTAALHGEFPRMLPSRGMTGQRTWIGHHCMVDPRATVEEPAFIGNHVSIGSGAEVKGGSVIGNGVIVDSNALVESSLVLDHTYIGTYINLVQRIASGKYVFNIREGSTLKVDDPIIVSGLREKILGPAARRVTDRVLALALLIAFSPIWLTKGLGRLVRGKSFFDTRLMVVADGQPVDSDLQWSRRTTLLTFDDSHALVSRFPGLWDVVSGKLALVGIRPLTEEDMTRLEDDWAFLRFESPAGLFTMLDTLDTAGLGRDEKLVIENYYASTRTFGRDLKILGQALIKLLLSR